jgi:hypothetical protein
VEALSLADDSIEIDDSIEVDDLIENSTELNTKGAKS